MGKTAPEPSVAEEVQSPEAAVKKQIEINILDAFCKNSVEM